MHIIEAWELTVSATRRGVQPRPFTGFDPAAFAEGTPESAARASIAILSQRRRNSARAFRFWRDLAVRKRRTEIDPLMGTVVALARESGVQTWAIETLIGLVHDVEQGRRELSWDTFRVLLDACKRMRGAPVAQEHEERRP